MSEFPKTKVSGDAVGGWIVEIHDGDRYGTYSPEAADAEAALAAAWKLHDPAPPEPQQA